MSKAHRPRVLLAEPLDVDVESRLTADADVVRVARPDTESLCGVLPGCDALIVRTHTQVSGDLFNAADRLRVVGVAGVGVDRVDLTAARAHGVAVLNTPAAASDAVAELTLALLLNLLRPIPRLALQYRQGGFAAARARPHGGELRDLTVGVIGMGRIGARVARICAAGFGARVLHNDIRKVGPFDYPTVAVEKSQIWRESNVVTLHTPLTDATRGLVGAETLSQMPRSAFLINTARGAIVKTHDLYDALLAGRIAGAALDVTDPEPLPPGHGLFEMDNCLLTPHVAARTHAGMRRMQAVVDDVLAFLRGELSADCEQNAAR